MEATYIKGSPRNEDEVYTRRKFLGLTAGLLGSTFLSPLWESDFTCALAGTSASELHFASALDAARAIRRQETTSLALTKHILGRIQKFNPSLNAIVSLFEDSALARARAADEAINKKKWWGPLHGVPITIKSTFAIAGVRCAPFFGDQVPQEDAIPVSRLRAAGAVILGHTNIPWPPTDWQTYNKAYGTTNNPWDTTRTPGGSTGGGAAALAAGLSYISLGSDLGGSIRVPAHFCGVYGHKPTLNLVPGPVGQPSPPTTLAVAGPLARSAADLKLALSILGGPPRARAIAYNWSLPPSRGSRLADYRIGFVLDDPLCAVSSDVKEVLVKTFETLKKAGARLEEGWPAGVDPAHQYKTYRFLLSSYFASPIEGDTREKMLERAKQNGTLESLEAWSWPEPQPYMRYNAANHARMAARGIWTEYFRTHDVFLMPTCFVPAFPHDHSRVKDRSLLTPEGTRPYEDLFFWASFALLTGLPATIAPVGFTKAGLPVGIQIMGPYLEDATPIDFAGALAEVVGGFRPPEGY